MPRRPAGNPEPRRVNLPLLRKAVLPTLHRVDLNRVSVLLNHSRDSVLLLSHSRDSVLLSHNPDLALHNLKLRRASAHRLDNRSHSPASDPPRNRRRVPYLPSNPPRHPPRHPESSGRHFWLQKSSTRNLHSKWVASLAGEPVARHNKDVAGSALHCWVVVVAVSTKNPKGNRVADEASVHRY